LFDRLGQIKNLGRLPQGQIKNLGRLPQALQTRSSERRNKFLPGDLFQVLQRAETAFRLKNLW
jgi:hypothetical protein